MGNGYFQVISLSFLLNFPSPKFILYIYSISKVGLTMTRYSKKNMISTRCNYGFMANLHNESWYIYIALVSITCINTLYMTILTLVSPVKMEYGWNLSICGLKMMMKSSLGKIFLKFFHALTMLFLLLNLYFWSKFSNKNDMVNKEFQKYFS